VAAISWYLKAASSGNLDAQYRLAMAYSEGNGVDKNFPKALDLWKKCARQGHQSSIQKLSTLGISPDD
jgi:TPR repeat protein